MKRLFTLFAAIVLLTACTQDSVKLNRKAKVSAVPQGLKVDIRLKTTPIKNQGRNSLCWIYAMLATLETERLMMGDSVHLSVDYALRMYLREQAERYYMLGKRVNLTTRGMGSTLLQLIHRNGILSYDTYSHNDEVSAAMVLRQLKRIVSYDRINKSSISTVNKHVEDLLDEMYGFAPAKQYLYHAQYTPGEFARSIVQPGQWRGVTSFTHHPYNSQFALECPDNYYSDTYYNVPLDTLVTWTKRSLQQGHPVFWEGDFSQSQINKQAGVLDLPSDELPVTIEKRQKAFENFTLTDDHAMSIVGMAHDIKGQTYFICKNSYGATGPYGGFVFMSENYFRRQTMALMMHLSIAGKACTI